MLNEKELLLQMLYNETDDLVQHVQKIHADFHGYAPREGDLCATTETAQESSNYILQKYVAGSWKHCGLLSHTSAAQSLRMYQKILSFGHFDEGYYRRTAS